MPAKKKSPTRAKQSNGKTPEPEAAPAQPEVETTSQTETLPSLALADEFSELIAETQSMQQKLSAMRTRLRSLQKQHARAVKAAEKRGRKNRAGKTNRKPSGFVKPARISDSLARFLGKPEGTEMARTDVTKEINAYIRRKQLQDPSNGRIIKADSALMRLLDLKRGQELTYFNLQRFMSPHFAKAGEAVATAQ
tara:strand:- start:82 stop:663 length:582 start_codon:yes stop_codon:yes gene_type:complete